MAPVMKEYSSAIDENNVRNNLRLILFGTALLSFFILAVVYVLSFRLNRRSPWIPVLGYLVLLRIMLTTEFYSIWKNTVFGGLSYECTNALMFFVTFALIYLLIFLTQEFFGIVFSLDGILSNSYVLHIRWALPNWQGSGNVAAGFAEGDGSSGSPFRIVTAGQLAYLAQKACVGTDYINK